MIIGFKDKETERIFYRGYSRRLPTHIQKIALLKLRILHACRTIDDFMIPPGNRFEFFKVIDLDSVVFVLISNIEYVFV